MSFAEKETWIMARIKIVDSAHATGKSKELLTALQNSIKSVPNLAKPLVSLQARVNIFRKSVRLKGNLVRMVMKVPAA
jgi:hypothetical protein